VRYRRKGRISNLLRREFRIWGIYAYDYLLLLLKQAVVRYGFPLLRPHLAPEAVDPEGEKIAPAVDVDDCT